MNKLLMLSVAILMVSSIHAQGRHEINAFIGGCYSDFVKMDLSDGQGSPKYSNDLWDLYEPHRSVTGLPVLTVDYHYILNSVVRLGGQASMGYMSGNKWYKLGNKPAERYGHGSLYLLPEVKTCIPFKRHFRPYAKAAIGLKYNFGTWVDHPVGFAWEVTPIGAEWGGQRVYGNAEFCWGNVIKGGRIGMGFRF